MFSISDNKDPRICERQHSYSPEKKTKMFFCNIFYKTSASLMKFIGTPWCNDVNVSQLTWIMSLHYLVKHEMLIGHMLPLSFYGKKLQNLSHLNCGLQIRQIWIQLITVCEG